MFYLANLVVETNEELQTFSGGLGSARNQNVGSVNTYRLGRAFSAGGCLGCHGGQGQREGYDFSVIAARAPVSSPEPINMDESQRKALFRSLLRLGQAAVRE